MGFAHDAEEIRGSGSKTRRIGEWDGRHEGFLIDRASAQRRSSRSLGGGDHCSCFIASTRLACL